MTDAAIAPESMVMLRYGGREYPAKFVPQCHVCTSDHRVEIERKLLVNGGGYAMIARSLPAEAGLSTRNIREHYLNGHIPMEESVRRVVIERRAQEIGRDVETFEGGLADHITFAEVGIQRAFERLMNGEIEPDMKDAIGLANFLLKVEEMAGEQVDQQIFFEGMLVWMQAIRKHVDPETFRRINDEIRTNPLIQQMTKRAKPDAIEAEAQEAE